jgi:hypothetical protein
MYGGMEWNGIDDRDKFFVNASTGNKISRFAQFPGADNLRFHGKVCDKQSIIDSYFIFVLPLSPLTLTLYHMQ